MGIRDLEFIAARFGWFRTHASRIARKNHHTDTHELVSTTCRRMGELPDADRFSSTDEFCAYTNRVMTNASIDHARKAKSEQFKREQKEIMLRLASIDFPDLEQELVVETINEMLMLDTGQRTILQQYCKGFSSRQIADQMGMKASTVRTRIADCKREIRAHIESRRA
ncbi:MAG: RNA polymerase sigma factor [Phycisphaerales bacterium]|nr:RNA polymerase sigma factor [Phycisphaerales bacterium]